MTHIHYLYHVQVQGGHGRLLALMLLLSLWLSAWAQDVTVVVASDLHFDRPPETDQYYHVRAINALGKTIPIDAVLLCGDIFDKASPDIQDLFKQRYEPGPGDKTIHYPVYLLYGNHDISPENGRPNLNKRGYELNMRYLDSLLQVGKARGDIYHVDPSSRSYSFNLGGVHFVMGMLAAGDTSYCKSNFDWLEADLKMYCSDGTPLVYLQHYGFDKWARGWWPEAHRARLMALLDRYNLAAFMVGHTHEASVQRYKGHRIYQVNNAWPDNDGPASFAVLSIKGKKVNIRTVQVLDGDGHYRWVKPTVETTLLK